MNDASEANNFLGLNEYSENPDEVDSFKELQP
jgi:hypothetical protein